MEAGSESELVDLSWIADTGAVGASTVSNWRRRDPNFPARAGGTEGRPLFKRSEVLEWGRKSGRFGSDVGIGVVTSRDRARAIVAEMRKYVPPRFYLEAATRAFAAIVDARLPEWSRPSSSASASGTLGVDDVDPSAVAGIAAAITQIVPLKELAAAFDDVVEQVSSKEIDRPTSVQLAAAMTALVDRQPSSVLDPAAGIGTLLMRGRERFGSIETIAWDIDTDLLSTLWLRFRLRGWNVDVHARDALEPQFSAEGADVILIDAPFGRAPQSAKESPRRNDLKVVPEMEWILRSRSLLNPDGVAVVHVPSTIAGQQSAREARSELILSGSILAVVALPGGMMPGVHTSFRSHLWVLGPETITPTPTVRVVDASSTSLTGLSGALSEAVRAADPSDAPIPAADVQRLELLRNDSVLTPGRWIGARYTEEQAHADLEVARSAVKSFDRSLAAFSLPRIAAIVGGQTASTTTFRALRESAQIERIPARPSSTLRVTSDLVEARILTGRFLKRPGEDPEVGLAERRSLLRSGDLVFNEIGEGQIFRVWQEDGWAVGSGVAAWRITSDGLLPQYLRLVLSSPIAEAVGSGGGTSLRFDPQIVPIPVLDIEEQARVVAEFNQLALALDAVTRARESLERAQSAYTNLAASGWLRLPRSTDQHDMRRGAEGSNP